MNLKHVIIPIFIAWLVSMYNYNVKLSIFIPIITIWLIVLYHIDLKEYILIQKVIHPNKVIVNNDGIIKEVWKVNYTFKAHDEVKTTQYFEDDKIATNYIPRYPSSEPSDVWVACFTISSMILIFTIPMLFLV